MPKMPNRKSVLDAGKIVINADLFSATAPPGPRESSLIPVVELHAYPHQPFQLYSDERMSEMVESVREHGILMPILVRPRAVGGYEIIAGHNRVEAARRVGLREVPATIREMDDDTAVILLVDSNLQQREKPLYSEKAFAFRMKLEAMNRQGARTDLTSAQVGPKLPSSKIIAEQSGESRTNVQRYIRLTYLYDRLLRRVDREKLGFTTAVTLSYLAMEDQIKLYGIVGEGGAISLKQAEELRVLSDRGALTGEEMLRVMTGDAENRAIRLPFELVRKYFARGASEEDIFAKIILGLELLEREGKL